MSVASSILSFAASLILVGIFAVVFCFIPFDGFINCEKSIVESTALTMTKCLVPKNKKLKHRIQTQYTVRIVQRRRLPLLHNEGLSDCVSVSVCLFVQPTESGHPKSENKICK